jgi:hypothetical protein
MCAFASEPAVPGVATECERLLLVEETVNAPTTASTIQPRTTRRRYRMASCVSFVIPGKLDAAASPVVGHPDAIHLLLAMYH